MKELKYVIDQLEVVSFDDCTKELSALENASVLVGNVEKLSGSEDCIVVSPLNNFKQKYQFKTQDIEKIEKIENKIFKVFVKDDSSCIVISNSRIKKRKKFNFGKMRFPSYSRKYGKIRFCDSCHICDANCDSCHSCDCDSCDCQCFECVCDGTCEWGGGGGECYHDV
ncbi:MAG: hypothetical protein GY845_08515 [Planctomycetes bacterium]|nr:hypothetical protein [Planctomycetota bacterium]